MKENTNGPAPEKQAGETNRNPLDNLGRHSSRAAARPKKNKKRTAEPFTDLGNARRLVACHGQNLRYCRSWGKWLVWQGSRWVIDDTGIVELMAKQTARDMYDSIADIDDTGYRANFARHAIKSEYASRIGAMVSLAATEVGIPVRPEDLDRDKYLLNCRNGTLDLRTGGLLPTRREDLITKLAPVDFDPQAECPEFDKFLARIMGGDKDLINYVQRCLGYALTGDVSEHVMFVLFGSGANGKTTLLEAVRHVLGDYAGQLPVRTLMVKRWDSIPNDIAQLKGLRFVTSSEVEGGERLAEAQTKQLTGGGTLQGRKLYHEYFEFEPTHKLFMDCNHKPKILGTDEGIWRRIRLIPFTVSIPEADRDKQLLEKLKTEGPGILAKLVRACLEWTQNGLDEPPGIKTATGEYREEMDLAKRFLEEECTLDPTGDETVEELYAEFAIWCRDLGEEPISKKAFGLALAMINGLTKGKVRGNRCWKGVRLKAKAPLQNAA